MKELVESVAKCLVLLRDCIVNIHKQNQHRALRTMNLLSGELMKLMEQLLNSADIIQQNGESIDTSYLTEVLTGIINAQEDKDYILLADLLELQLEPFLRSMQEMFLASGSELESDNWLPGNLSILSLRDKNLEENIKKYSLKGGCVIEPTSSGYPTMKVTDQTGSYYFHSNVNPVTAGKIFAEQYYTLGCSRYTVFGFGLGYHIKAMCELDEGIYIDVYEPDMEIIKTALTIMDMEWMFKNPRIRLIWDPEFINLHEQLEKDTQLVIYYPALRHIQDGKMRLAMEKFFIKDSSIRNFRIQFESNFRDNIRNCDAYVDSLENRFQNKNAVIVAAGPSLDKNIELLREKPDNTIVVAVGTVFHKLVDLGIQPDFVVFLDVQKSLYRQIEGLENMNVPLLCVSTTCKQIMEAYQGEKYLVCQRGYDRAEMYAEKHGYRLYETGGSVSTIALDICLQLGCKSIAYIGLDLAYTGERTHAQGTADYAIENGEDKEKVLAVGGGMVPTSKLFLMYKEWIERRAAKKDAFGRVVDATEGGAVKKGLRCLSLKEVFKEWDDLL